MDLTEVAVPHTLAHLKPLLPPPPATLMEVGCGRGALAAMLADLDFSVTAVERDHEDAEAARERELDVFEEDFMGLSGEYDVVLFTRSLHHADDLDAALAHAAKLLVPGGVLAVEEFAWDRVDAAAANFLYTHRSQLVAADLLDAELPAGDPLQHWIETHDFLHRGADLVDALRRVGGEPIVRDTEMLWRLVDGRSGRWGASTERATELLTNIRQAELDGIAAGTVPSIGFVAAVQL